MQRLISLFNRFPFRALWIAGFTTVPFYPFRFLVVFADYPLVKYLLAVFLARTPHYYLLALAGDQFQFSDTNLIVIFLVLFIIPFPGNCWKRRKSLPT